MGQNEQRALLVVTGVLAFSTLMLASATRWAACVSAGLAILSIVPLVGSRRVVKWPQPLLLLIAIPLVATLLQLVPLPAGVVRVLAPARYDLAAANAHAYGGVISSFMPLSQDWPATLVELAKFAGYLAFAYVCTRLSTSRRARLWILVTVSTVGVVVALCALGHRVVGAKSLLGIYVPTIGNAYDQSFSPFLNPNHLAGYMALVVPLCLALAIQRRSSIFFAMAGICVVASLQADSRAGVVSLIASVLVTLLLVARSLRRGRRGRVIAADWIIVCSGLTFVALVVVGATAGQELFALDLQREQELGKILAWRSAPELLSSSPWFGIGRGAFEYSFTHVQPSLRVTFSHIENEYLQAALDWGLPVAIALVLATYMFLHGAVREGRHDVQAAGALGAIASVLVHSFMDFGLELPGMAFPAIAVAASLLETKLAVCPEKFRSAHVAGRTIGVVAAVFLCALAASSLGARPNEDLHARGVFDSEYSGSPDRVIGAASQLARRHPSSYLVAAETARKLLRLRDPRAFAALSRALALNPSHYGVHLLAAHLLESSQEPRQALAEYRAALMIPGGPRRKILESVAAHFPASEDLILAIPSDPKSAASNGRLLLQMKRPDAAEALAHRSLQSGIKTYDIYEIGVQAALATTNAGSAVEIGREAHQSFHTTDSLLLYVGALRASSLPLIAIGVLERFEKDNYDNDLRILSMLLQLQVEAQDFTSARRLAGELLKLPQSSISIRKAAHLNLATIEEHEGNRHQAVWHRQQAAELRER